ncbi:hypothetical protein HAX54_045250 [Datura stramonium]|uniref:FGAR-AT PurM N-terminal-like domain-containing protein n=1 Tax=Datura stramonium TaxID=4076 RepID=A0ABS8RH57_DATST|nr:hypothetical protein [Datura stramonium]
MGGGAASSMVSGQNDAELDFTPCSGDAEMGTEVISSCSCFALKWEQDAILAASESRVFLQAYVQGKEFQWLLLEQLMWILELEKVLGDMPKKTFEFSRMNNLREPLDIAPAATVLDSLKRVLRLPSVCSKITLADVAVIAQTYTDLTGGACSIGEQPIKGLLDPKAMARLAVGEALTNLVWAKVTSLSDVKASGNWMYAAKLDGEGAAMYDAAVALSEAMIELLGLQLTGER